VLSSNLVVPPSLDSSDCTLAELKTNCDREHSKVLKLEAEVLKRQHMLTESEKRYQLQGKDETIRNLQAHHDINDGFKVTNATQKTDIAKLKAKDVGNKSSGTTTPTNLKVLTPGMYTIGPKYIIPHRRTNRETPIPISRKKHVTFKEPPKPSPRVTKKLVAPQVKKANVVVHLSTGIKSATGASKTASKNHAWIYRKLPANCTSGEKVEDHPRNLNKQNCVDSHLNAKRLVSISNLNAVFGACHECLFSFNHDKCVVYSMNFVKPKATPNRQTTKKVWKQKVVAHAKPQWMPTGWHFTLYDSYPLTRILDPMEEPLELSPIVSSSSNVIMLSRFANCQLSDRKTGSKGISAIFE
nr:hypothetical protein [Tanacetum cinerariifolium]